MASLLDMIGDISRQRSQAAAGAGGLLMENPVENAALGTMLYPGIGDVTGLLADAKMYATEPEERNLLNYGLTAAGLLPFVPAVATMKKFGKAKPKTKSEKIAQKVLNLLEKGEIDKITADMLSEADDAYLAKNYDLPMDTESRLARAEEMGFDLENVMYHGTNKSFDMFDTKFSPDSTNISGNVGQSKSPIYTSDNPNVAASYAPTSGGQVYPLVQSNNIDELMIDAGGDFFNKISPQSLSSVGDNPQMFVEDLFPKLQVLNEYDIPYTTDIISEQANLAGIPRITFENVVDRGPVPTLNANEPSTVVANLSPSSLRSPFARFDPRLKDFENILAGIAPVAVLTPSVLSGLLDVEEER